MGKKKNKKNKSVEIGTTVELDANTNKITKVNNNVMSKNVIATIVAREVKKEDLVELIKTEKVFKKRKKELLEISNFMSLKKEMLSHFDEKEVKAERAKLPKIERKAKEDKVDPETEKLVNSVKSATKPKQLKKIAKAEECFNWKDLKKCESFPHLQNKMLKVLDGGYDNKPEPPKPKMIPNPLVAEIEAFENSKKLKKWAANQPALAEVRIKKTMAIETAQGLLLAAIPAEVEAPKEKKVAVRNWAERKAKITELIEAGEYARPAMMKILEKEFPGQTKANGNTLSECKNPDRWEKFGRLDKLVVLDDNGVMSFVSDKKEKADKPKKEKKNKKGKGKKSKN